ncbi:acetyltransferase (GNAT) family protein [Peptococcaceae bacterium CEB3]|nr:acetyltransferase (GNAT) family protein [Peptococcaceae bacterium CEB3]
MDTFSLIKPDPRFEEQFVKNVKDFERQGELTYFDMYKNALLDFDEFVNELLDHSRGSNLPAGWTIPYSTYWLINEKKEDILGCIRIRHRELAIHGHIGYDVPPRFRNRGYGTKLLRLAIERIPELKLKKVIIACEENNISSLRVIENSNGIFMQKICDDNGLTYHQYEIEL